MKQNLVDEIKIEIGLWDGGFSKWAVVIGKRK
jgi:hypothetical protein